jgi:ribonuclease T1
VLFRICDRSRFGACWLLCALLSLIVLCFSCKPATRTTGSATAGVATLAAHTALTPHGQASPPETTGPAAGQTADAEPKDDLDLRHVPHVERAAVREVAALMQKDGPFPYTKDGSTFLNLEKRLPQRQKGFWREYTVPTKGSHSRGARRIVAGKDESMYYTNDHYDSFVLIRAAPH